MARSLAALAALAFLAGCTAPSSPSTSASTTTEPALDASTFHITLDWVIASVQPNSEFTFGMHVHGSVSVHSDHVGAHMGPAPVPDGQASATAYPTKCAHQSGRVPNDFTVTCTAPSTPGKHYLRGHVMVERNGQPINWWSPEVSFDVK